MEMLSQLRSLKQELKLKQLPKLRGWDRKRQERAPVDPLGGLRWIWHVFQVRGIRGALCQVYIVPQTRPVSGDAAFDAPSPIVGHVGADTFSLAEMDPRTAREQTWRGDRR